MKQILLVNSKLFFLAACLVFSLPLFAQDIEVTGKVTDEYKEPLIGVSILIKGTNSGTTTDIDGSYAIKAKIGDTLILSYPGFRTKEMPINQAVLNVKFDDPGCTFYSPIEFFCNFKQVPPQITGAWSEVEEKNFTVGNIYHPYQLIRGRVPGLTISKPGGDPLGNFDIQQRGLHTILGSTEPLVVVNGLPGASLQTVDPQDIESVAVLRDAAMTSLYGTRGANGVVLIETKKSIFWKKLKVTYSGYASIENTSQTPNILSASQFRSLVNTPNTRFYNSTADLGATTDWAEAITRMGLSQAHNLSFEGRMNSTNYRLSLNYRDVNGVARTSGFNQSNALLNISQDLFKNKVRLTANAAITHRNFTEVDKDLFYHAATYNPTAPVRADTSRYGGYFQQAFFDYMNPVALLEQIDNQGEKTIKTANGNARWSILDGLDANVHYSWQQQNYNRNYTKHADFYPYGSIISRQKNGSNILRLNNQSFLTSLSYYKYFNRHEVQIISGYQHQNWTNELRNTYAYDLVANSITFEEVYNKAALDSLYKMNTQLTAFFGILQYSFGNWWSVNANWRHEGATRFGENNKWGNFYGFGTGIDFAQLLNISFANILKLRLSYGMSGNLPVDGVYANMIFRPDTGTPVTNANPDLKWEARREWNGGLDFGLFNSRVNGSLELYHSRSENLLFYYQVPSPPNLANTQYENFIDFKNKGLEFNLSITPVYDYRFSWEIGLNYAKNRTEMDAILPKLAADLDEFIPFVYLGIPGFSFFDPIRLKEGAPLGELYGLIFDKFERGLPVFKDVNKDGVVCNCPDDYASLGNAYPRFTLGLNNNFRWKSLEMSFFLRGVFGHKLVNAHLMNYGFWRDGTYNVGNIVLESERATALYGGQFSSLYVEDGSFIQLENLVIGYNFKRKKLSKLKVYAAAQNLFTLSGYSGTDSEVRLKNGYEYGETSLAPGIDTRMAYFPTRTFTLGVQAEF